MNVPGVSKEAEEYTEIPVEEQTQDYVKVVVEKLDRYASVDKIIRKLKEGNIVIAKIKELKDSNEEELRHSITKIRTACESINGDIAGVGEEWLIVTPNIASISREE